MGGPFSYLHHTEAPSEEARSTKNKDCHITLTTMSEKTEERFLRRNRRYRFIVNI